MPCRCCKSLLKSVVRVSSKTDTWRLLMAAHNTSIFIEAGSIVGSGIPSTFCTSMLSVRPGILLVPQPPSWSNPYRTPLPPAPPLPCTSVYVWSGKRGSVGEWCAIGVRPAGWLWHAQDFNAKIGILCEVTDAPVGALVACPALQLPRRCACLETNAAGKLLVNIAAAFELVFTTGRVLGDVGRPTCWISHGFWCCAEQPS